MRHRKVDGFVILPAAFSDGRLSREAWRAVKACLGTVRSTSRPSALRVRAVCLSDSHWEAVRSVGEIPIRATWVEVWRTIHRVHGVGVLRFSADDSNQDVGVAVEPVKPADG
ncbi:MAG: hypothetical protein WBC63_00305 [Candidatus Bipolaricaulia bacterium]